MTLTLRQKILIPILIIVLLYLAWEVNKTFSLSNASPIIGDNPAKINNTVAPEKPFVPKQVSTGFQNYSENQHPLPLTENQKQYINLVSQYQRLQLEKMIAENDQAIATAKLNMAQAQAKLAQINYQLQQQRISENPIEATNSRFQLVYTGQIDGHWTATLRKGSELLDVVVGDNLENGAKVVSVNGNQVILQHDNTQNIISFNGEQDIKINKTADQKQQTQPPAFVANQSPAVPNKNPQAQHQPDLGTQIANSNAAEQHKPAQVQPKLAMATQVSNPSSDLAEDILAKVVAAAPVIADAKMFETATNKPSNVGTEKKISKLVISSVSPIPSMPQVVAVAAEQDKLVTIPAAVSSERKKRGAHHRRGEGEVLIVHRTVSERELLSMNPHLYTVQLLGSHKKSEIDFYIIRHKLADNSWPFKTTYHHRPWYALVFGKFSTVTEALAAIDDLPHPLKAHKPFIRRIGTVQYEITRNRIPKA